MDTKKAKNSLKRVWNFIWNDNSVWSWIVNIILAFVIIKFVVYPGLGLVLQTSHPIVAVVSGSMEHKTAHPCAVHDLNNPAYCIKYDSEGYEICGNVFTQKQKVDLDFFWYTCGSWYIENNITKSEFQKMSFKNGFNKGDIMILYGTKPKNIEIGDIIVFRGYRQEPIIHRVVKITESDGNYSFQTKGDHNKISYTFEQNIQEDAYIGRAVVRVPLLGYVKILAVDLLNMVLG
ncbi:signal peptidase I [Candidatus Woesearchaeota archaeon]|nr:signal peptidase I [Candidatus Woesearchaeota archaeon]